MKKQSIIFLVILGIFVTRSILGIIIDNIPESKSFVNENGVLSEGEIWTSENCKISIDYDDKYLQVGQLIHFRRESGMSKRDVPDNWEIDTVYYSDSSLVIKYNKSETIEVLDSLIGDLDYDVISLPTLIDNKNEEKLNEIWHKYSM